LRRQLRRLAAAGDRDRQCRLRWSKLQGSEAMKTRLALAAGLLALLVPYVAHAEYRAYELEVADTLDCKLNKRDKCKSARITTALSPDLYIQANGGDDRINVVVLATWMCYGDTSQYREVCPRPGPRSPRFNAGEDVRVTLKK